MRSGPWTSRAAVLLAGLLAACNGTITSPDPLITPATASYPFPAAVAVAAQTLGKDHVWESIDGTAHLTLVDRAYRVTNPGEAAPSADTFLFSRVRDGVFIVQGRNDKAWAYGLVVRADRYYLFAFAAEGQTCAALSAAELRRFDAVVKGDGCSVSSLRDLTGLLLHLRERFPWPTSAFDVR